MKKIVIFGATGGIGAYTTLHLYEKGIYDVIAVGHRRHDNGFFMQYGIKYYCVDISQKESFSVLPQKDVDVVINFAGVLPARGYDPHSFISSFVIGTLNIMEYMHRVGCEKIISAQTPADLWYLQNSATPIPPDAPRSFPPSSDHSIYTIAKNAAIDIIEYYHNTFGISRFIFRFFNVYLYHPNSYYYVDGIKRKIAFRYMIEQAEKGDVIEVWGNPLRSKEILYVKDLAQLVAQTIEIDIKGGIYNVGGRNVVTLEEQIDGIIEVFTKNSKSKKIYCPNKPDALFNCLDSTKTHTELGFQPMYSYVEWLKDFKKEREINRFELLWGKENDY